MESDKPVFVIIYVILEAHSPFCSPILKEYETSYTQIDFRLREEGRKKIDEISTESALYLDSLNEYYAQFLSKDCVRIYMSDHGCILNQQSKHFTEELVHITFVVTGGNIKRKETNLLFSLKNLYELLEYILDQKEDKYDSLFCECLDINGIDLYSKEYIDDVLNYGLGDIHLAYCGVRTIEDVYILEAIGDEYYGTPCDIKKVENVSEEDLVRLEELRKMCKKLLLISRKMKDLKNRIDYIMR